MTFSADERFVYFQVSFHHGFVKYDLAEDRLTRVAFLPETNPDIPREDYVLDSAHHGIAMNPQGTKLCVAGTMSDYATIVSPVTFAHRLAPSSRGASQEPGVTPAHGPLIPGEKPYWATSDGQGRYCWVSFSGQDRVAAISHETGTQVASIPVGDYPQRMRFGFIVA
jgi:DNA-binding beta-propeller fold protein YncE